ncbi:hypothetical protein HN873_015857 [Arachis hypogaea]
MKYTAKTRENSPRSSGTSPLRTLRIQSLGKLNPIDLKRLSFHMSPPHRATQNKKINEEPDREMEVDHKDGRSSSWFIFPSNSILLLLDDDRGLGLFIGKV